MSAPHASHCIPDHEPKEHIKSPECWCQPQEQGCSHYSHRTYAEYVTEKMLGRIGGRI